MLILQSIGYLQQQFARLNSAAIEITSPGYQMPVMQSPTYSRNAESVHGHIRIGCTRTAECFTFAFLNTPFLMQALLQLLLSTLCLQQRCFVPLTAARNYFIEYGLFLRVFQIPQHSWTRL